MSQNRIFTAIGTTARLNEPARDYMALGLWLAVLIGALFLSARGPVDLDDGRTHA